MGKKNNNNKSKEKIEVSVPDRPIGQCSCCHMTDYVDELRLLPEVEVYTRQLALSFLNKDAAPEHLDEQELIGRYGYDSKSVFCYDCLQKLLSKALN